LKKHAFLSILLITLLVSVVACSFATGAIADIDPQYRERLNRLEEILATGGCDREELQAIFADSRVVLYPHIIERTGKGINYLGRRFGLLSRKSLERGRTMLTKNLDTFRTAEAAYGVEREIVLAVLRVETNFGQYTGKSPVFNSLLTLALLENRRSLWAEGELLEFLRYCKERHLDPLAIKGSWAGAFGMCQFIPSSFTKFAVDGNGDGAIDLFNLADAVASIANYLKAHGWEKGKIDRNREALLAYNRCDSYVEGVLAYARAAKRMAAGR
jgi:membrane-bound lytic murein transglycosylase B